MQVINYAFFLYSFRLFLESKLSNRTLGIVKKQNMGLGNRPIIEIMEEDGKSLDEPYQIDLSEKLDVVIVNCVIA